METIDPEVERWAKILWIANSGTMSQYAHKDGEKQDCIDCIWNSKYKKDRHVYRNQAKAVMAELLRAQLVELTAYNESTKLGEDFDALLADWACGNAHSFEVWDFVKNAVLTQENKC